MTLCPSCYRPLAVAPNANVSYCADRACTFERLVSQVEIAQFCRRTRSGWRRLPRVTETRISDFGTRDGYLNPPPHCVVVVDEPDHLTWGAIRRGLFGERA